MQFCAISGCHSTSSASLLGAGLDLTVNSSIGSRLVGVMSAGKGNSMCKGSTEPYLVAKTNPAMGLFVDKLNPSPPCGVQMPQVGGPLTSDQQNCIIQWATGLANM
jgi:hypothetical protein